MVFSIICQRQQVYESYRELSFLWKYKIMYKTLQMWRFASILKDCFNSSLITDQEVKSGSLVFDSIFDR